MELYIHINLINNKVYVGISENSVKRWGKDGYNYRNSYFGRAIKKYGWDNFLHEILYDNLTYEEARQKEIEMIEWFDCLIPKGYNASLGGDLPSDVMKEKISNTLIKKYNNGEIIPPFLGKELSEETKRKISDRLKGKPLAESTKVKISNSTKGKRMSEETKRKISESRKGMKFSQQHREALSKAKLGMKASEETKRKMSQSHKRRACMEV